MAVDEALLADAIDSNIATLRLYAWNEPTLSLGYFQRYDDRHAHAASRDAATVRRQSGGGAILHDRELTYSVALPAKHPLARHAENLYSAVHKAFIAVLAPHVAAAVPGCVLSLRRDEAATPPRAEPFLCFQRRAKGDLLFAATSDSPSAQANSPGLKILGSAQRRRQGAILQHGSLLLDRSAAAPELAGLNDLAGTRLRPPDVGVELARKLGIALGLHLQPSSLSRQQEQVARGLESGKYAAAGWTKRR
jgi:lipoate-protein ligase A